MIHGLCMFCECRILQLTLLLSQIYSWVWLFILLKEKKKRNTFILRSYAAVICIIYFLYRLLNILQSIISSWWKFFLCINKVSLMATSAVFRNLWKIFFLLMQESVTLFLWHNYHYYWILPLQSTHVSMQLY